MSRAVCSLCSLLLRSLLGAAVRCLSIEQGENAHASLGLVSLASQIRARHSSKDQRVWMQSLVEFDPMTKVAKETDVIWGQRLHGKESFHLLQAHTTHLPAFRFQRNRPGKGHCDLLMGVLRCWWGINHALR